jgi:hypothetical protein
MEKTQIVRPSIVRPQEKKNEDGVDSFMDSTRPKHLLDGVGQGLVAIGGGVVLGTASLVRKNFMIFPRNNVIRFPSSRNFIPNFEILELSNVMSRFRNETVKQNMSRRRN